MSDRYANARTLVARCRAPRRRAVLAPLRATGEEEGLSQRYEAGVSPLASGRLVLEHEPGRPLGVGDPAAEVRRADHRDRGAINVMPLASGP